ncbi:unnamed protein product [Ceratitis capitata]|uniref:(Mediterranean fruit fly) hypothetical protein n=1 Tax=Ceratitis capitata TaxID=7213 RepID=A0A811VEB4_CERCA|nr:unnamed protein product [Ceratitis capitata]
MTKLLLYFLLLLLLLPAHCTRKSVQHHLFSIIVEHTQTHTGTYSTPHRLTATLQSPKSRTWPFSENYQTEMRSSSSSSSTSNRAILSISYCTRTLVPRDVRKVLQQRPSTSLSVPSSV